MRDHNDAITATQASHTHTLRPVYCFRQSPFVFAGLLQPHRHPHCSSDCPVMARARVSSHTVISRAVSHTQPLCWVLSNSSSTRPRLYAFARPAGQSLLSWHHQNILSQMLGATAFTHRGSYMLPCALLRSTACHSFLHEQSVLGLAHDSTAARRTTPLSSRTSIQGLTKKL